MRTSFTPSQDQFLKDNYLKIPSMRMAEIIGKSKFGTCYRMKKLGLEIPQETKDKWKKQGLKKGQGWNKGLKQDQYMSRESIEATRNTRFKKGNQPHNTRSDSDLSLRSDGYVWVRVAMSEWKLLHREVFEQYHQVKLKTEDNIIFRDGNRSNFDPVNLQKVSNEELMEMNTIHRYPENLKSAIRALSKLKKHIRKS